MFISRKNKKENEFIEIIYLNNINKLSISTKTN
jgi:hypothetical protein